MKRYEKYKGSGIAWIGEIPEHWDCSPLKYIVECNKQSLSDKEELERLINYVEISDVNHIDGVKSFTNYLFKDAPSRARRITNINDIIISTVRTYLGAIAVIKDADLIASTGFAVLTPRRVFHTYLGYVSITDRFIDETVANSTGVSYPAITSTLLINISVPLPAFSEQQQIADYLDWKCGEVDKIVAVREEQIKLLGELRASIISRAVTKGLNPDAPLKDSGIAWIGEIPEHWEVRKIKFSSNIKGRIGFRGYNVSDLVNIDTRGCAIVLGGTNIMKAGYISYNKLTYLSEYKYFESPEIMLYGGEILITKVGAGTGENAIYEYHSDRVTINPNVMMLKCYSISSYFLNYYLLSDVIKNLMKTESVKCGAQPAINQSFVNNIESLTPSLEEQERIVEYLDWKCAEIDSTIAKYKEQVAKLKEYRQALITEVVTGKIDVRDVVIPKNN